MLRTYRCQSHLKNWCHLVARGGFLNRIQVQVLDDCPSLLGVDGVGTSLAHPMGVVQKIQGVALSLLVLLQAERTYGQPLCLFPLAAVPSTCTLNLAKPTMSILGTLQCLCSLPIVSRLYFYQSLVRRQSRKIKPNYW